MLNEIINVDLHIHSKKSKGKESNAIVDKSDVEHLDVLFNKLQENHINLFSITDHNLLDADLYEAIDKKIESAKYPEVQGVIPGIEFDVQFADEHKPCHIMAYFDTKKIEDYRKIDVVTSKRHPGMKTKFSQNEFGEILHEIDLPVILIAYQRKALDNISKNGSNSFSDAVDDVAEQIRYGYISGFDIHRPDVEGMVRNNLHSASGSMQLYVGMLIASDCHEWSAYPKHDIRSRDRLPIEFSHIKALPTFKGLLMALTSPATRFARFVNTPQSVIKSFTYKLGSTERKINLSPGINVIVGENGSGKSTLLDFLADEKLEDYENKIVRSNELKRQGYPRNKEYVRQAELIQQYHSGKLTSHGIYEDAYPVIDTSDFEQRLNRYIRALIDTMDKRLKANAQLEAENRDIVFQQDRDTFFC